MNWMQLATYQPYMHFCPRSYEKVAQLFQKVKGCPISKLDYETQPKAYFRKMLLLAINAISFQQAQKDQDAKLLGQIHTENKSCKEKVQRAIKRIDQARQQISVLKGTSIRINKAKISEDPAKRFHCPICQLDLDSKQAHQKHYRGHLEEDLRKKNNQLIDMLVEQQKVLLSNSRPSPAHPKACLSDKEKQLDQLIQKSQSLISSLANSKEEVHHQSVEISDHLLRLQRYEFERRSSQQHSRLEERLYSSKEKPEGERLCYFQPDSQGLIHLAQMRIESNKPTLHSQNRHQQSNAPTNEVFNRTESICVSSSHPPSTSRFCCREQDFVFDESRVHSFTGRGQESSSWLGQQSKRHELSSSVDFTISNDSNSVFLHRLEYSRPSLLIQQDK